MSSFPAGRRAFAARRAPCTSRARGSRCSRCIDALIRFTEPYFPAEPRQRAIDRAVAFVTERLNGEDGLGAIFPAMANAVMMYDALGYPRDHPDVVAARKAIEKLIVLKREEAYCQPCVSPVWDTVLACHALMERAAEANGR